MPPISFSLDGTAVTVDVDPKTSTLDVLREHLGVFTCKPGCSPQGLCGCCTTLIDGKPRLTCTLPVKSLAGKSLVTIGGIEAERRERLADCFVESGASQCGYCTPGIVLSACALLDATEGVPTDEAITRALNQHLCRCTGYTAIFEAIRSAAGAVDRPEGRVVERPEGCEIVLGDRPYVADLERPGMLHAAPVFAPPGELLGIEGAGIEGAGIEGAGIEGFVRLVAEGERVSAGTIVAAVLAEDPAAARRAAAAVSTRSRPVEAEVRVIASGRVATGDVEAALAGAAVRAGGEYVAAPTDPVFLEPEAALAVPVGDEVWVYSSGHDAAAEERAIGAAIGAKARVLLVPSGGSYGGKEGLGVPVVAARLAREAGRPVRLALTMEQGMRVHARRPGSSCSVEVGADATGRIVALRLAVRIDGGEACADADRLVAQVLGAVPYVVENVAIEVVVQRTGAPAAAAIRGGAAIAAVFALERCVDRIARELGVDPLALRAANVPEEGRAVLDAVAPAWPGAAGVAIARMDGSGGARVVLTVASPSEIEVRCNVPELGQGRDETVLRVLRQITGLDAEVFTFPWGDASVGAAALPQAQVERAARVAAEALMAEGGALEGLVGRVFVGEDPDRAAPGWSAQVAVLDEAGAVRDLHVAVAIGEEQDARLAARLAEGASHMGAGVALSEEVEVRDGLPETRLRMLGVLKPKGSPRIHAIPVAIPGGPRDVSEVAVVPTAGAIANAVSAFEGSDRVALPMRDSAAAKHAGARQARG